MLRLVLVNIRQALEGSGDGVNGATEAPGLRAMNLASLPIAIRVDTTLPMRDQGSMEVSKLVWVSPERAGIQPRRLEAMLFPN
jgi:hypothetical protein